LVDKTKLMIAAMTCVTLLAGAWIALANVRFEIVAAANNDFVRAFRIDRRSGEVWVVKINGEASKVESLPK